MSENNNLIVAYLREHVRKHKGLPYWSLAMGIEGVMMEMGWTPPVRSSDLKPCPFCRSNEQIIVSGDSLGETYWVECGGCLCEGPWSKTKVNAVEAWNNRTNTDDGREG